MADLENSIADNDRSKKMRGVRKTGRYSRHYKKHSETADDGAYQVDLVVAFFSILLILFVVYSAQVYSKVTETSKIHYLTEDQELKPFRLRSFAALYPYRDYWIVKDGQIARLSLPKITQRYVRGSGAHFESSTPGVDMYLTPLKNELVSYKLRLLIYEKGIPGWLVDNDFPAIILDASRRESIVDRLFKQKRAAFFFIWDDQRTKMSSILAGLRQKGFPHGQTNIESGSNEVLISIRGSDYGLQNILRSY